MWKQSGVKRRNKLVKCECCSNSRNLQFQGVIYELEWNRLRVRQESVTKTDSEQKCIKTAMFLEETTVRTLSPNDCKFIVEMTIKVYSPMDYKFGVEPTIKFKVETTIKDYSPKEWKFRVETTLKYEVEATEKKLKIEEKICRFSLDFFI